MTKVRKLTLQDRFPFRYSEDDKNASEKFSYLVVMLTVCRGEKEDAKLSLFGIYSTIIRSEIGW